MNWGGCSQDFGRNQLLGEENPFFSIKRVFLPQTPTIPKRTTKGLAALWTLAWGICSGVGDCSLRDWARCEARLCSVPCLDGY